MLNPTHLRCEYLPNPLGIDIRQPRLSWVLESEQRAQTQSAYQILVADKLEALAAGIGNLWDSGRVESNQTTHVIYAGQPLQSERCCYWQVRVWDQDGQPSNYSQPTWWQMGLLEADDWQGQWISFDTAPIDKSRLNGSQVAVEEIAPGADAASEEIELPPFLAPPPPDESTMRPSPYLRRTFTLTQPVKRATLYATARGLYEAFLNGQRVGDALFTPGWTDYNQRIEYQTYDVTKLLQQGQNSIGAVLADGWYAGYLGPWGQRDHYGVRPAFFAQLNIELADGRQISIVTDGLWKASDGPIRSTELYHGETYDATQELGDWTQPDFDDGNWQSVLVVNEPAVTLSAQLSPSVRITEELNPVGLREVTEGVFIFDMGQNMVGWTRLQVSGERGTRVRLRFSEIVNDDGTLQTVNLGAARATDVYILKGNGDEVFEPRFTYHGFRYVEITGYPGQPTLDSITGCVVHADLPQVGTFTCSNPTVNKIYLNTWWGQRGNFMSIPTDCPQRAERLGWTGDVFVFARTGTLNMDAAAYYTSWMRNVVEAQSAAGAFPDVAPRAGFSTDGAPAWGDVGIFLPWLMYQLYGDTRLIELHYEAMTRWMTYIGEVNPNFLRLNRRNVDFGDWVSYNSSTPTEVLGTAIWALNAKLMAEMSKAIGYTQDRERYDLLYTNIRSAFMQAYVSDEGRVQGDTQTGYVLALHAGLIPESLRPAAAQHLVADIEARDWHLSTGFVGTPFLLPVLSDMGHADVAYRLLTQTTCPSWGYMVEQGATTMWERWDADVEMQRILGNDSSEPTFVHHRLGPINGMDSFNHFGFGAVVEWLYRYVAGIEVDPDEPGYKHVLFQPQPGGGLTYARATLDSPYGLVASAWELTEANFHLSITVPPNTHATVRLPAQSLAVITEGGKPLTTGNGILNAYVEGEIAVIEVGSGQYEFVTTGLNLA